MHRPHSNTAVARLRLAAFLLLGNCVWTLAAVCLLVHSLATHNRKEMMLGTGLVVFILVLVIVQWMAASRTGCPLCRTPVLAPKRCMKHRQARTLLGSYRLRVAASILLKNQFRCPFCNESTRLEIREILRSPRYSGPKGSPGTVDMAGRG